MIIRYTIKDHDGKMIQSGFYDDGNQRDLYGFSKLVAWAFDNSYVVSTWSE